MIVDRTYYAPQSHHPKPRATSNDPLTVPSWVNDAPAVQGPVRWEAAPVRQRGRRVRNAGSDVMAVRGGGAGTGPLRFVEMRTRSVAVVVAIGATVGFAMNFAWQDSAEPVAAPVTAVEQARD